MAQTPLRAPGCAKCPCFNGKEVIYVCERCDELACTDCATKRHKGHDLIGLADLIPEVKLKLEDFIQTTYTDSIPRIKEELKTVDNDLETNKKFYQEQINKAQNQNASLKKELDNITEKLVKSYRDMEEDNVDKLATYKLNLVLQADELDSRIQKVRDTLQSANDVLMYDVSRTIVLKSDEVQKPETSTMGNFTPGKISLSQLEQLLGEVLISKPQTTGLTESNQPTTPDWHVASQSSPLATEIIKSIHTGSEDRLLICGSHSEITVTDQKGVVLQTLNQDVGIRDFCLTTSTQDMWFISYDDGVREVKGQVSNNPKTYGVFRFLRYGNGEKEVDLRPRTTTKFKAQTVPLSICVTSDDHVVLGHENKLVKYSQSGEARAKSFPKGWLSPPAVRYPRSIAECSITFNLAVADWENRNGGNSPAVKILDKMLKSVLFSFSGHGPNYQTPPKPFLPWGVCFTSGGELIVTDWNNKSVLLLSGNGVHQQILYISTASQPRAVCVLKDNTVFVSFADGNMKVLTRPKPESDV